MDCPVSIETTLGELGDELLAQLKGRRFPLGGSLELTERCNLRCVHCYINQPASSREVAAGELKLPQVRSILDQISGAGCLFLLLTGGEVLVRPDFEDIYRYAKGRGLLVSLFTNGTLLTPRIADLLAEWRPYAIEITLYGATPETYERVTGVAGSFARCMRGIELLLDRGLRLGLKTVLLRANRHELEAMRSLAEQFGVSYRFDGLVFPRLDGDPSVLAQRLSAVEVAALDQQYPERQQEFDRVYQAFGANRSRSQLVYDCGAGYYSFHVDSRGRLSACMMARRPSYDILQTSFQKVWDSSLAAVLSQVRTLDTPCTSCTARVLCPQCPAWSQLVHSDDETLVDYVCELGRLRAARTIPAAQDGPRPKPPH